MKKNTTFESAMVELENIVNNLEKGELPLDDAIGLYEKGVELAKYCNNKLDEAQRKITIIIEKENGDIEKQPISNTEEDNYGL